MKQILLECFPDSIKNVFNCFDNINNWIFLHVKLYILIGLI